MVSFRSLALAVAVGYVSAQEISTLDKCAATCLAKANELFAQFSCAAGDISCMCPKGDWKNAVNDCAKAACPADYAPTVTNAVNALCATAVPPPPPAAAVPSTTAEPAPPATPTTTPPPATTAPPASSSSSPSSSSTSQTEAAKLSKTSSAPSTSSTTPATKSTPTKASTTTAAPTSTTEPAAPVGGAGMTTATKIGVGVGVTAAIAALIGAVVFFILRRRQQSRNIGGAKHWKISEPMPSPSSRHYENDDFGQSYETGLSDLEMKSRRYEDMVPRQKPRQMV